MNTLMRLFLPLIVSGAVVAAVMLWPVGQAAEDGVGLPGILEELSPEMQTTADAASHIVTGRVLRIDPLRNESRGIINSLATIRVDGVLKGEVPSRDIRVAFAGGRHPAAGSISTVFVNSRGGGPYGTGTPNWRVGERVLAYLADTGSTRLFGEQPEDVLYLMYDGTAAYK